ncbi:MAG: RNA helicase, partial [candidate division Zixibacteria bacterium]|nr:RNA helicase [candidate division Zixibacteria bacterium]
TDIASRGIDVPGIEHIINFDIPQTVEEYIHRAGRTARMENVGLVSTIASWMDKEMVGKIEETIKQKLPRCTVAGVEPYVEMKARPFRGRPKSRW